MLGVIENEALAPSPQPQLAVQVAEGLVHAWGDDALNIRRQSHQSNVDG